MDSLGEDDRIARLTTDKFVSGARGRVIRSSEDYDYVVAFSRKNFVKLFTAPCAQDEEVTVTGVAFFERAPRTKNRN